MFELSIATSTFKCIMHSVRATSNINNNNKNNNKDI